MLHIVVVLMAVDEAIKAQGFTVQKGGMRSWSGFDYINERTQALAEQIGSGIGAHDYSPSDRMSERANNSIKASIVDGRVDWKHFDPTYDDLIPDLDPKSRRVLYESGHTTARTANDT